MTNEEAIKILKKEYLGDSEEMELAKYMGWNALENQIPKKPIGHWYEFCEIGYTCPTCDKKLRRGCKTCKCGQRIDWGEGMTNEEVAEDYEDIKLIRTNGLDEGIRCALCTNPRHTERGCDGGCQVNEHLYDAVMNTIHLFIVKEGESE